MADDLQVLINVKSNADEATRGLDRLQGSIVKNTKAAERLRKDYAVLDRAFNKGRLSAQQYAKGVQQIDAAIEQLNARNSAMVSSTNKVAQAQMAATKASNRMGVVTQQAGYQVSDFIVQVQSGTNAFVAFGQQASQLVGVLPLIASPLGLTAGAAVALSAGLGIAIPLVTAIGAAFTKSSSEAEKAAGGANSFSESLDKARESSYKLRLELELLNSAYKDSTEQAFATAVDKASTRVQELESRLKNLASVPFESQASRQAAEEAIRASLQTANETLELAKEELQVYKDQRQEKQDIVNEETVAKKAFLEFFKQEQQIYEGIQEEKIAGIHEEHQQRVKQEQERKQLIEKNITEYFKNEQQITDGLHKQKVDRIIQEQKDEDAAREETLRLAKQKITEYYNEQQQLEEDIQAVRIKNILDEAELRDKALKLARLKFRSGSADLSQIPGEGASRDVYQKYLQDLRDAWEELKNPVRTHTKDVKDNRTAYEKAMMTAQEFADALDQQVLRAVDGVADAFSDFLAGGLRDFKSFVGSIKDMFIRLLADMAAMALKQRIIIPIATGMAAGFGSSAAAQTMASGTGSFASGTIGSTLAAGASALGSGFMAGVQGFMGGGISGYGATLSATAANAGTMATIGAALPAIIAVAAVVGLLTKKTKLLDSGLRATVEGFDVAIETFQLTQTSRLFGLLKGSKKTTYEAASADVADPLIKAIGDMQQSIVDAAGTLGIGADAFDDFSYQFKLSLKGLTEEEQLQKINEEITKMGDSFASLTGHFETMNELLAVAQQRYDLETRLLQLQGNETELLIRQRERERAATHELNQGVLAQIHAIEDAQIAANKAQMLANEAVAQADLAFATVQRSIQARKETITRSFNEIMETIQNRIEAANENVSVSQGILSSLEGASSARIGMGRAAGLSYLRELRGASRITDQKMLDEALEAVADPSQGLYTNFVDYQRDFADQSNLIRELEEKAGYQLDTDEQTLLQLQDEAAAAQSRYEAQIDKLDEQLAAAQNQIDALKGIDTSVKSVEAAIAGLGASIQAASAAQAKAAAAAAAASKAAASSGGASSGGAGAGVQAANAAGQQILNQLGQSGVAERKSDGALFQKVNIRGSAQLLQVASDLGVKTSGKTGAQIQQAISNAGNLGVNMDNATRALKFAMGGNFGGGLRMVGERGPELEATGPSRIFSTKQTAELFRNPELVAEVRSLREEVAGLRSEQRQLQASNSKYVKRNYDINRKWDTEGLPATRT